jgi:hypothetical protein
MKYTTMYERYQEVKKKSRVKGSKATATEKKYLFKAVRLFFPLYKEAVKILSGSRWQKPRSETLRQAGCKRTGDDSSERLRDCEARRLSAIIYQSWINNTA